MRPRLLRDFLRAFESAAPAHCADTIDEYRELAMLARAWEGGSLEPRAAERASGPVGGAVRKKRAGRRSRPSTV